MKRRLNILLPGLLIMIAAVIAACGGSATGTPTAPPTGVLPTSTSGGADAAPAEAARAYFLASLMGEGDVNGMICSSIPADVKQQMQDSIDSVKNSYAQSGATIDMNNLTFESQNVSGDTAEVVVSGSLKVVTNGVEQDVPYPQTTLKMKDEGGWKVCA